MDAANKTSIGPYLIVDPTAGRNQIGSSYQSGSSHSVMSVAETIQPFALKKKPLANKTALSAKDVFRVDVVENRANIDDDFDYVSQKADIRPEKLSLSPDALRKNAPMKERSGSPIQ